MSNNHNLFIGLAIILCTTAACSTVNSGELASMEAADLKIEASIYQYSDDDDVSVYAIMRTAESDERIEFSEGETLSAYADTATGHSNAITLDFADVWNDYYGGSVEKAVEGGSYHITYTESDDTETTAEVFAYGVPEITSLEEGDEIVSALADITWDVWSDEELPGTLTIDWESDGADHGAETTIENTGSYQLNMTNCDGEAVITLTHLVHASTAEGFAEADIDYRAIHQRTVTCDIPE